MPKDTSSFLVDLRKSLPHDLVVIEKETLEPSEEVKRAAEPEGT